MPVQDAGLSAITTRLGSGLYIAVGTGTGAFGTGETAMYAELVRVVVQAYRAVESYLEVEAALTAAQGVGTLREIAVFDAASGGSMWSHDAISPADVKPATEGRVLTVRIPFARQV